MTAGDVDGVLSLFAPDAKSSECGWRVEVGHEALRTHLLQLRANTSKRTYSISTLVRDGDVVVAEWQAELTFRPGAQLGSREVTERFSLTLHGATVFRFAGNLIAEIRHYFDRGELPTIAGAHVIERRSELPEMIGTIPVSDRPLT